MNAQPILSVVIATKNRAKYCFSAIQSNLATLNSDCELIVQDNSSDDELAQLVEEINDCRLQYFLHKDAISFVDNFNKAIENSKGKYICVLGDDDTVTEDILTIVQWMHRERIESVCSSKNVDYVWPNNTIEKYRTGTLSVPAFTGHYAKLNVKDTLNKLVKDGIVMYQRYGLPRTYHGIVKRSCMEVVRDTTGHFFGGLTPDIYSTVALSCVVKTHYILDFPFTIAGACPASASVANMQGKHAGRLSDAPHLRNRPGYIWDKHVPAYYSVETIWAETALKALAEMRELALYNSFNLYRLGICGITANRKFIFKLSIQETLTLHKKLAIPPLKYWSLFLLISISEIVKKTIRAINKELLGKPETSTNILVKDDVYTLEEAIVETRRSLAGVTLGI